MGRKKRPLPKFENVTIQSVAAEGKAIAKIDDKVIFVPFTAPGDVVDIKVVKKKRSYLEGKVTRFHHYSDKRIEPKCSHFGLCGGCKWQHISYEDQLINKNQQVIDSLERIAKVPVKEYLPIMGSDNQFYYRNKLEYTFSNRRWLTSNDGENLPHTNGVGFHLPGLFDKILDIDHCYLQKDPSNDIRLFIKDFANTNGLSYYDVRNHEGLLRNLIIRTSSTNQLMVIVIFAYDDTGVNNLLTALSEKFPEITSLMYVINGKKNETIWDQDIKLFKGQPYIIEKMTRPVKDVPDLEFKVGPISFYQTNPDQARKLYQTAFDFAELTGDELVYDLYTGTGTIAAFISQSAKKVVGIESVEQAIEDAKENSKLNNINNTVFYAGDMLKILTQEFIEENGTPDVIFTDPPRAGMHEKVVKQILRSNPEKIVYVSCNPATQARDIALLSEQYTVEKIQPVDMFPHTHHVENVALLKRKS